MGNKFYISEKSCFEHNAECDENFGIPDKEEEKMEEKDKSADNVMDDLMNLSLEKIHENAEKQGYSATHAKLESPSKNDHETSLPGELEFDNFEESLGLDEEHQRKAEKQGDPARDATLESSSTNDHETSLPGELELDNFKESLGLDEEHQRKADAEKQGDPARDATLESSSTNEDETSLPDNAKLGSFSLELDDKHHRKADREKQEGSISIFSEDNREFSFQTDKVNAESKIKKISGTISKNQIPENKTRLELPESNESSTLDIAIQKKSKVTPVYKTVGKEIDICNVEMDPIKESWKTYWNED
ncbi:hypothetical protein TSAR_011030 [Trichomalopsis sarcophagae]|uniref:Uncharacterized protein n=1 Tax=Trichomalopsis sarcophagae TaxID=543379 RepID=A0A232ER53_9HYME|nr:hypothetical protein TSAR_011030 [Trichomalopsis sarcophagae]